MSELRGVLMRDEFRRYISAKQALRYLNALRQLGISVADPDLVPSATRDANDDYLVAVAHWADRLISGDKDLIEQAGLGVLVTTPRDALEAIERAA
jgi:predicted nucleic acid-binding protein